MIQKTTIVAGLLLLLALPLSWAQERAIRPVETNNKQALVIGNGNYAHAGVLRNPANDARAIGKTLQQLGFKVTTVTDGDKRQMDQAIRKFGVDLRGSNGVGLFFYAGHGMQIDGENYLLPTDINPSNEFDVAYDAVPVGKLLGQMQVAENKMNIVILDACRNNPFARSFRSSSKGLAQVVAPTGSFISYATAPGNVAADGEGDNGLFTEKLLQHITTPGLKLEEIFKRVRSDVQRESNDKQVPWDSSSVTGDFFFVPMAEVAAAAPTVTSSGTTPEQDFAAQAWDTIKNLEDPKALEEFIKVFPGSPQSNLAKFKLLALNSSASEETPVSSTPPTKTEPAVQKPSSPTSVATSKALAGEAAKKKLLETKKCPNCELSGADLRVADLSRADLSKANLWRAKLNGANLSLADLNGAILFAADLRGANLFAADLSGADLSGADLSKANLWRAKLNGADLSLADLSLAELSGAFLCNTTIPDGSIRNDDC